ncbi:Uncharacterised protein [Segatella copri]|nr:Uncharacterised protein [Segatella copri]
MTYCISSITLCRFQLNLLNELIRFIYLLLLNVNKIALVLFDLVNSYTIFGINCRKFIYCILIGF